MNETASASEGIKIVKIAKETQRHHHTKTCKKNHQIADLECQDIQCGKQSSPNLLEEKLRKKEVTEGLSTRRS